MQGKQSTSAQEQRFELRIIPLAARDIVLTKIITIAIQLNNGLP